MKKIIILTILFLVSCETSHKPVSNETVLEFEKLLFLHQLSSDSTKIDDFFHRNVSNSVELRSIESRFNSDLKFRAEIFKRIKTKNDSVALDSALQDYLEAYRSFILQDSLL